MAIAMVVAYHIFGYKYTDPGLKNVLIYFEAIMTCYAIFLYLKFYKGKAFKKMAVTPWLLVYSLFLTVILVLFIVQKGYLQNFDSFITTLITTIFIAISEEIVYRGIVLQGFFENNSKFKAIICSAILFSLLHFVNIFAGFTITSVILQLLNTFVHGVAIGCLMILTANIIPFIIFHFVWDFIMLSSSAFVQHNAWIIFIMLITDIIFAVVLLKLILNKKKEL
ncbi:CPBP family intramembrane glutamic endopeptidase [Faecalimonas sp.]